MDNRGSQKQSSEWRFHTRGTLFISDTINIPRRNIENRKDLVMKRAARNTLCSLSAVSALTSAACTPAETPPAPSTESAAPILHIEYDHRIRMLADGILRFTQVHPEISYNNQSEGKQGARITLPNKDVVSMQRQTVPGTNTLGAVSISKQGDPHQSANLTFSFEQGSIDAWTLSCDDRYNELSATSDGKLSVTPNPPFSDKPFPGEAMDARQQSLDSAEYLLGAVAANDLHMINNSVLSCSPSK